MLAVHNVGRVLVILNMWRLQFFKVFCFQAYLLLTFIDYKNSSASAVWIE